MNRGIFGILGMVGTIGLLGSAAPALAATGVTIPEPTHLTLIAMAVAGLVIGRRNGRRPPEE